VCLSTRWRFTVDFFYFARSCFLYYRKLASKAVFSFSTFYTGANRADGHLCEWISILVQTGVFNDATAETKARYVVADVAEACRLILELEKYQV